MWFIGSCVFFCKRIREVGIDQYPFPLPLQQKTTLSQPPQMKMLFVAGKIIHFAYQFLVFFCCFNQFHCHSYAVFNSEAASSSISKNPFLCWRIKVAGKSGPIACSSVFLITGAFFLPLAIIRSLPVSITCFNPTVMPFPIVTSSSKYFR